MILLNIDFEPLRGYYKIKDTRVTALISRRWSLMKISRTFSAVVAAATILLAVTSAVAYFLYRVSREKAYNEKWEDYIDCGI